MKRKIKWTVANKLSVIFTLMFIASCLKLCAQTMTPAQALLSREKFVEAAKQLVGKPYEYGAVGPDSFDCSGFIFYTARESVKIQLPRTAKAIYSYVRIVPEEKREIGDLLFFNTSSTETINHVGIYIGNNQFISAISDGENTGVIVSSLNQSYWRGKYRGTGQFLPSGKVTENENNLDLGNESDFEEEEVILEGASDGASKVSNVLNGSKDSSKDSKGSSKGSKADNLLFDADVFVDWALISQRQFAFKYRGIDVLLHASYSAWTLNPGFGLLFRFNYALGTFQMPLILSLTANDYIRVYAGPVFTFKKAHLPETSTVIKPSVFPGIIGASFSTPAIAIGKFKLQGVQDVNYSVCNSSDGSALNFVDSMLSGLVMTTGVRVTFPLSLFF